MAVERRGRRRRARSGAYGSRPPSISPSATSYCLTAQSKRRKEESGSIPLGLAEVHFARFLVEGAAAAGLAGSQEVLLEVEV